MILREDATILERGQYCRREFGKRVAAYFKAGDVEIGRINDDILHSLEHLVFVMWDNRETPSGEAFKEAYDTLMTAAGRLRVDTLSSHLSAVTEAVTHGDSLDKALSELMDYFNMLIG
ncbi:MAG: hypothetical protein J5833_07235 [Victivallales bacterium]|nr:hypothetical protein [Victivallales bacterium]